jgi:hypothetical protein
MPANSLCKHNKRLNETVSKPFTEIDGQELEALIARVTEAKENNLALSPQDSQLLLDALLTLASMQDRLTHHNVTIHKLRKLLGIEKSSEKQTDVTQKTKKPRTKKRTSHLEDDGLTPVKPTVVIHPLTEIKKGDNCPECLTGKIYKTEQFLADHRTKPVYARATCDGTKSLQYVWGLFHGTATTGRIKRWLGYSKIRLFSALIDGDLQVLRGITFLPPVQHSKAVGREAHRIHCV